MAHTIFSCTDLIIRDADWVHYGDFDEFLTVPGRHNTWLDGPFSQYLNDKEYGHIRFSSWFYDATCQLSLADPRYNELLTGSVIIRYVSS